MGRTAIKQSVDDQLVRDFAAAVNKVTGNASAVEIETLSKRKGRTVTKSTVGRMRKGDVYPTLDSIAGLANAFDMKCWQLLYLAEVGIGDQANNGTRPTAAQLQSGWRSELTTSQRALRDTLLALLPGITDRKADAIRELMAMDMPSPDPDGAQH